MFVVDFNNLGEIWKLVVNTVLFEQINGEFQFSIVGGCWVPLQMFIDFDLDITFVKTLAKFHEI